MKKTITIIITILFFTTANALEIKKKIKGIVLKNIESKSTYFKLGLRSHDKIIRVNNQEIEDFKDFKKMMKNVKTLTLIRKNKEVKINYGQ